MCEGCNEQGTQRQCPTCRAAAGGSFPLEGTATLGEVLSYAWQRFTQQWPMLVAAFVISTVIIMAGGLVANMFTLVFNKVLFGGPVDVDPTVGRLVRDGAVGQVFALLVGLPVQGVAMVGLYRVCLDVALGRKAELGRLFAQLQLVGRFTVAQAVVNLVTLVPTYLVTYGGAWALLRDVRVTRLIANPGLYLGQLAGVLVVLTGLLLFNALVFGPLSFFTIPELIVSEAAPGEVLARAWKLGSGQRLRLFGFALLMGVVLVGSVIACCLPVVAAVPFVILCNSVFFLALRKRASLPAPKAL